MRLIGANPNKHSLQMSDLKQSKSVGAFKAQRQEILKS